MTEEIKEFLKAKPEWYASSDKRIWSAEELAYTYNIYNLLTGENRVDTGCGSCRRSIISQVRGAYVRMLRESNP